MASPSPEPPPRLDVSTWSDVASRDALELILSSVAQMVGFEVAAVSVVSEGMVTSVAVYGNDEVRETLIGMQTPIALVQRELAHADDWGRFKFVPHERLEVDVDVWGWVPDLSESADHGAWNALDLLIAPLLDPHGTMIGLLSIDLPFTGKRPDATQRLLLERYAIQTERALRIALEREALAQRVRLAETARAVVRFATSQPDIERVLDDCRHALLEGFRADDLTIRTYASAEIPQSGTPSKGGDPDAIALVHRTAHRCWERQEVAVLTPGVHDSDLVSAEEHRALDDLATSVDFGLVMLVPLGAGSACLGHLILSRKDVEQTWSADEQHGALDIARDIGQAVLNSRTLAREQRLVGELRRLDTYKSQLLSTVSHELKNPLSAIAGHIEMLGSTPDLSPDTRFSVDAIGRAARRLTRVVDNLLVLAEVEDPTSPVSTTPIDVRPLLRDAVELAQVAVVRRDLTIEVETPDHPVLVRMAAEELDRVLTNLVSNAVKYTPRGGTIGLTATQRPDEVELSVADAGIGISENDRRRLFTEFFRSSNPEALAQPGTGLGLAISARIVARHHGRIEVESELGRGSTFRVVLPSHGPAGPGPQSAEA